MYPLRTEKLAEGVFFHSLTDPRFKINRISVNCFLKMDREKAAAYAMLPFLLRKRNRQIQDITSLGQQLQRLYGASFSADCLKMGDNQVLSMALSFLDDDFALSGEKLTYEASQIAASALLCPVLKGQLFLEEDIELEKQNLIELLQSEFNEKRLYALNQALSLLCADDPHGFHKYGSVEQVQSLDTQKVTDAYTHMIASSEIHILFIGRAHCESCMQVFYEAFGNVKRHDVYCNSTLALAPAPLQKQVEHSPIAQSKFVLGFAAPSDTQEQSTAMMLMGAIWGGTPISKLFVNVREKMSLCYYCAAQYDRIKGIILVDSGVQDENINKTREAILQQLQDIANGEFSDQEMLQTALALANKYQSVNDSVRLLEQWYLTQICLHTQQTPQQELKAVCSISREQIIQAAQKTVLCADYVLTGEEKK